MTAGTVTLGIPGNNGPAGWTTITPRYNAGSPTDPATNSNIIYVSNSTGVDSNGRGTLANPVKTLHFAVTDTTIGTLGVGLRNGFPDWVLGLKGDTWTNETFNTAPGVFTLSGASQQEPMVINAYSPTGVSPLVPQGTGTGARPLIKTQGASTTSPETVLAMNDSSSYVIFFGWELYCYDRDPNNIGYNYTFGSCTAGTISGSTLTLGGTVTGNFKTGSLLGIVGGTLGSYPQITGVLTGTDHTAGSTLSLFGAIPSVPVGSTISCFWEPTAVNIGASNWTLCENCKITFYNTGIGVEPGGVTQAQNIQVRRCVVAWQYGFNGLGLFIDAPVSTTLIENLIDQNGYNDQIGGFFTRGNNNFNHGLYLNGQLHNVSGFGGPATLTGNIYSRDVSGAHMRTGGFLTNNLWVSNVTAMDFGRYFTSTPYSINLDVYTENVTDTSPAGAGGAGEDGTSVGTIGSYDSSGTPNGLANYASGTLLVTNVIWSNSQASGATNGYCLVANKAAHPNDPPNGVTGVVTAQSNIVYNWPTGDGNGGTGYNASIIFRDNTGGLAVMPNRMGFPSAPANANRVCITPTAVAGGYDNFGGVNDRNNYPDPTRSLESYAATIGLPATLAGFLNQAALQSQDNWNANLTAYAVNDYIRAGFGIGPTTASRGRPVFLTKL